MTGGTDSHMGGDRRVGSLELPTPGHRQQPGVEAGGGPDRETLFWIGAGSALAAELFWDGQLDGEPAVRGPAVPIVHALTGMAPPQWFRIRRRPLRHRMASGSGEGWRTTCMHILQG